MVASVNPVVAQPQTQTRNLPVPMSHYRQQIIKPPFVFNAGEDLLENKFPGINTEAYMADCFEKLSPEQQAIVRETVGEENIPKRPVETPKTAVEVPKSASKTAETTAETAANAAKKAGKEAGKGKWGWIVAGAGVIAAAIGGKTYMDNKKAEQQQLNLSA